MKEGDGAAEEADCGGGSLVGEHFGVGEPAVVVDGDVHVLSADRVVPLALAVGEGRVVMAMRSVADALAGAALDPVELVDVDVDELTGLKRS